MSTENPPAKTRTQPPIDRTASEDLAHEALITLRSAQIDTTFTRGDIGPWSGLHLVTLLLVMTAIFLWALIRGAGAGLSQSDFIASPPFLATGIILLATGTSVLLATAAGPLGASHPLRSWLLTSPADRAALIRGSYRAIGIACGIIGAVALGFAVSLTGHGPIRILTSTSLGFAGGLTLTKILAVGQHRPGSEDIARLAGKVLIAIASLTLTLGVLPGWSTVAELYAAPTNTWGPALDLLTTVVLILLMWRLEQPMRASARHLSVGALARGGDFVDALSVSTVMLDS
ncbi:DUF6297 family protein, partial [Dermatophilus congolensis]